MKNLPFLIEQIHSSLPPIQTSFTKIHSTTNAPSLPLLMSMGSQKNEPQNQNINEKDLKKKIMTMLTKDRDKYFAICQKYINGLAIDEDCDSIINLMTFIQSQEKKHFILNAEFSQRNRKQIEQHDIVGDSSHRGFLGLPSQKNSPFSSNTPKSQNRLNMLSLNTSFLSQRFSRDKIQRLIQLNSIHKNVLNFLQYLKISLQAFAFDEEKCWILMKDEVERHLLKSERNIDKLLELRDEHQSDWQVGFEGKKCKSGGKMKHRQKEDMMKVANEVGMNVEKSDINENTCSDVIKKPSLSNNDNNRPTKSRQSKGHNPSEYPSSLTFRQYKLELRRTKQRILTLQVQSSNTLKQSLLSWYRKFLQLVMQLKQDLAAVCGWIAKAEKFDERREEKQSIIQFLLINRAKGIEGLVFLEQIYKSVLVNIETKRREFCSEIEQNMMTKLASLDSHLVCKTVLEREILTQVNTIFFTVQDQLNITNSTITVSTEIETSKVNENQSNELSSMSLVEQCCSEKNKNLRQTQPSSTQLKEKLGLSNIYFTPEKKQKSLIQPKNNQGRGNDKEKQEQFQKEGTYSNQDLTAQKSKNIVMQTTIPLVKPFTIGPHGQETPQEELSSSLEYLLQQKSDSSKPIPKTPEKKKKPPKPQVKPQVKPQQDRHPFDEIDELLVIPQGYFLSQRLDDQKIQMKEVLSGKKQRKNSDQHRIFF